MRKAKPSGALGGPASRTLDMIVSDDSPCTPAMKEPETGDLGAARGHSQSAVARLLGVTEGTVRYHRKRRSAGAADGRSRQDLKAAAHAGAIAHWRDQQADGRVNIAALHDWLRREHGYDGSLKSVQRYWKWRFPAPAIRRGGGSRRRPGRRRRWTGGSFRGGSGRRGGGPRCADRDAVVEPEAGGRLGAVEGHAVVAGLPDRLLPAPGRRAGGSADRQREDGDRQGRRELCANLGDAARSSGAGFGVVVGDPVGECDALDDHWQLVRALQTAPCLRGGLDELEHHELRRLL